MKNRPAALVTGASRGIGRAISLTLSKAGFNIAGLSRSLESSGNKKGLHDLEKHVTSEGVDFMPIEADIGETSRHAEITQAVISRFGRIDILVNNAGIASVNRQDMLEMTVENYDRVLATNLHGAFFLTQAVARQMIANRETTIEFTPKIIFITSISAEFSSTNRAEYCVAKAGLSMTSRLFADRLVEHGIHVFEIRPGIIQTDMTKSVRGNYDKLIAEGFVPQKRWGQPEDVAKVVGSIVCGDFDFSTGSIFEVSGGMNIHRL